MPWYSVRYEFSQLLDLPAEEAYRWCTNYQEDDPGLMGMEGKRSVNRLTDDTVFLTDSIVKGGKTVVKKKLIRLDPATRSWTNTYIAGPSKFSQFLYRIVPEGNRRSRLHFTGFQVFTGKQPAPRGLERVATRLTEEDSATWRLLAGELRKETRNPTRSRRKT